ncbi:MAG: GHKL domain-containing protein [Clostridia bacterium]|jgi:two-component system, OmpR family, sensor histidine kinase VanS|nr:GHKL domain-containing protein [Clostridia bacterium]
MKSIRIKLFLQIGVLIVLLIVLFMSAYSLLFEPIYMAVAKNKLLNQYRYINELERSEYDGIYKEFEKYNKGFNVDVFILDSQGDLQYQSKEYLISNDALETLGVLPTYPETLPSFFEVEQEEVINDNVSFFWANDSILDARTLNVIGNLNNGDHVILRVRLIPPEISIVSTNRFAPIVGIILLFAGMLFAYILSNKFTRPLITMNKVATELSNLNFETTCPVESKDEMGQLAQKINVLSNALKNAIGTLNVRNNELENQIKEKIKIDENRKQLLNNVSHELKTPLTLMQSYADGLKSNVAKDLDKVDYYCDVIIDETEKMNRLITDLLDINRIRFGDVVLNPAEFEIVSFIRSLKEKYQQRVEQESIQFSFEPIEPTMVIADQQKVDIVLSNYVNNAIKYVDDQKTISIRMTQTDQNVRIEVFNTCSHIPDEELPKLWDSFYKVDQSRDRNLGGHGLGLSIVKAIQEADGSGYGVQNQADGITFWMQVRKGKL